MNGRSIPQLAGQVQGKLVRGISAFLSAARRLYSRPRYVTSLLVIDGRALYGASSATGHQDDRRSIYTCSEWLANQLPIGRKSDNAYVGTVRTCIMLCRPIESAAADGMPDSWVRHRRHV